MRIHEAGGAHCPDTYGLDIDCNGVGIFAPDPFAQEIYEDDTPVWMCDGQRYGSAMDI